MKTLKFPFFILALALFVFTACEKDKEQSAPNVEQHLIGTWKMDAIGQDMNEDGEFTDDEIQANFAGMSLDITLNADYTGSMSGNAELTGDIGGSISWTLSEDNKHLQINSEEEQQSFVVELLELNDAKLVATLPEAKVIRLYFSKY